MVIDCHAHAYLSPKLKISPEIDDTFLSAEQQIRLMDEMGIDKAVLLPLNGAEAPAERQSMGEILYICEKYPGRFIPFCNIDPRLPKHPEMIKVENYLFLLNQYKNLGCKGMGEMVVRLPWNHPLMLMLLEACETVGFPVTFHTITPEFNGYGVIDEVGLPKLEMVLKKFPGLKFFAHSTAFWNEISGDVTIETKHIYPDNKVTPGGRVPELMRKYPNLYGDFSASSGLSTFTRDPEFAYKFIEEFQDRLLLGLDSCSMSNRMGHLDWLGKSRDAGFISLEVYEKIVWKNINRVLDLGIE